VDALVLAGGSTKGLTEDTNVGTKALIDINGRPMLAYILDALKGAGQVGKITVVLPSSVRNSQCLEKADIVVNGNGDMVENFYTGLSSMGNGKDDSKHEVLVISADIPLITSEAVDDFIKRCREREASLYYPIVSKSAVEKRYPKVNRTYMALREGRFTGGNFFLFDRRVALRNRELLKKVIGVRKSPLDFIRILGLPFIVRFIFHWLTLPGLEKKISDLMGAKGVAVPTPYVEVSIDVDKVSDLDLVRAELAREG